LAMTSSARTGNCLFEGTPHTRAKNHTCLGTQRPPQNLSDAPAAQDRRGRPGRERRNHPAAAVHHGFPRSRPAGIGGHRPRRSNIFSGSVSTACTNTCLACRRARCIPAGGATVGRPRYYPDRGGKAGMRQVPRWWPRKIGPPSQTEANFSDFRGRCPGDAGSASRGKVRRGFPHCGRIFELDGATDRSSIAPLRLRARDHRQPRMAH
jgi:hypothetical protein